MIEVDISNVWGDLALPDLLEMEKKLFDAHRKLTEAEREESPVPGWLNLPLREKTEELTRIRKAAERIRCDSEVCVVVGTDSGILGVEAAVELLQGAYYNLGRGEENPRIFFAGNSLSTRKWNELMALLEGKDFSVIVVSRTGTDLEAAIAFRGLRWMLERKYGTDEASARIYAVTAPEEGALHQMAQEAGWETFAIPADVTESYDILTAAGLLPLAVAGVDILEMLGGAMDGKEAYDLRAYENPVWLYTAVRNLLYQGGRQVEALVCSEPDFLKLGSWWQRLFGECGGSICAVTEYSSNRAIQGNLFETMVRFAPPETEYIIGSDWKDLEGLNHLEGKPLSFAEEQAWLDTVNTHVDSGTPVIAVDCGNLSARTLGELFYFLQLSCGISAYMSGHED